MSPLAKPNVVRVRATIEGVRENTDVYFRAFDVDDPSSEDRIDDNGADGNDNRSGEITGSKTAGPGNIFRPVGTRRDNTIAPHTGRLRAVEVHRTNGTLQVGKFLNNGNAVKARTKIVDGKMIAEVDLLTSFNPGDNFRVMAALDSAELFAVSSVNETGKEFVPTSSDNSQLTPQLSVWRRLNIEHDLMENNPEAGDRIRVQTVSRGDEDAGKWTITIVYNHVDGDGNGIADNLGDGYEFSQSEPPISFVENEFAGGILRIEQDGGPLNFRVISSEPEAVKDGANAFKVIVERMAGDDASVPTEMDDIVAILYQDDFDVPDGSPHAAPTARVNPGTDTVRDAMRALMTTGSIDRATNRFVDAYIDPVFLSDEENAHPTLEGVAHSDPSDAAFGPVPVNPD